MKVADLRSGPVATAIRDHRLIVVLRQVEPRARLRALVDELADAGARIFEITFDAPSAGDDMAGLREHLRTRSDGPFVLGAGTLARPAQLDAALRAGADFGVAPTLDRAMVAASVEAGMPFVPGGLTPTEIAAAWDVGATFVKLFPASAVGSALVRELRGPLPEIELIPTGGVDAANAAGYLAAGAVAVGIGGAIVRATPVERRAMVEAIKRSRR